MLYYTLNFLFLFWEVLKDSPAKKQVQNEV